MSSSNSHERITEKVLSLPGEKKSQISSWRKSKAREEDRRRERRRATDNFELAHDMRKFLEEIRSRRKRPSIINTIKKFFA